MSMSSNNIPSAYFKVSVVSHGNKKVITTQLLRCDEDMTFSELFNITKSNYPFRCLDENFEIFLTSFEKEDFEAQMMIPDKEARFSDTCFDEDICPFKPVIEFRVNGFLQPSDFATSDDTSSGSTKDTAELDTPELSLNSNSLRTKEKIGEKASFTSEIMTHLFPFIDTVEQFQNLI